jgi:ParB family transcriptional regulator, chromosome partitioning protein
MTVTTPKQPAHRDQVLQLLTEGTTATRTAELTSWPRSSVVALINRQRGWLLDAQRDVVINFAGKSAPPAAAAPAPVKTTPTPKRKPAPRSGSEPATRITDLPVDDIALNPNNIRGELGDLTDLAASIRRHGILQPVVVRLNPGSPHPWQLIAGHRRLAAAYLAGLDVVPAVIRTMAPSDDTAIELMLIENCHRENLTPMEKAAAFGQLRDLGHTQQVIANRTGFSLSSVNHYLLLLDLDDSSQERVRSGELKVGDAVRAVRRTRQKTRKKAGSTADFRWEPDHLTGKHPLAKRAQRLCDGQQHTMRRRIGEVACGHCWETAIRQDERTVIAAEGQ